MATRLQLESVTIAEQVLPRLEAAGWSSSLRHKEYPISPGGLSVVAGRVRHGRPLWADFALLHEGQPIAVVECKRSIADEHDGVQQARRYANRLDVPLAYATNGRKIIEIDVRNQQEHEVTGYRAPQAVWDFYRGASGLDSDLAVRVRRLRPVTLRYSGRLTEGSYGRCVSTRTSSALPRAPGVVGLLFPHCSPCPGSRRDSECRVCQGCAGQSLA